MKPSTDNNDGRKTIEQPDGDTITVTVQFNLPSSINIDQQEIKEAVAAILYYNGTLSEHEACPIIGLTRRQFEETVLPKFGLSVIGGTQSDIEIETEGL